MKLQSWLLCPLGVYRVLRTPQAGRLRDIATSGRPQPANSSRHSVAPGELCQAVPDGRHGGLRALTTMSPLQYQKQLSLETARQRMLMDVLDATSAAYEVGYESV